MISTKTRIKKTFEQCFALNKSKAIRLNDIIESNLNKTSNVDISRTFKVTLSNEKQIIVNEFNSIFELDNGKKNRITELELLWRNKDINIVIQFLHTPEISVDVSSSGLEWTNQLFAEIEEQVERVTLTDWVYRLLKGKENSLLPVLLLFFIGFLISSGISSLGNGKTNATINLTHIDKVELSNKLDSIKSNDDKIDFIFTALKKITRVDRDYPESRNFDIIHPFFTNYKNYAIIIPIFISLLLLWYVIKYCYPRYIFAWGDMEEEYENILDKRKNIWNIFFGSILLSILTNFFVWGLTR